RLKWRKPKDNLNQRKLKRLGPKTVQVYNTASCVTGRFCGSLSENLGLINLNEKGRGYMHIKRGVLALIALLCLLSGTLVGQTFRGALAGSVADSSGAGVPDAAVKIEHKGTGLTRTQNTGASGDFNFPELGTGIYTVSLNKHGFQADSQDIEVAVG